ncbi:MAG: L-aspartate oxidase [Clostridiaceae bacterium]|nr:L-aspartate oxidase [Clostridiaceae bacterium]
MPLRYLTSFDTKKIESEKWDVVVIGSGVAGLYSSVNLDPSLKVCILSKETLDENNSYLAQGGIAAAIGLDDMPEYHFKDTVKAGAGHCNEEAVNVLVEEAPKNIEILCEIGTNFDRNPDGTLTTTREGGHGRFRIIHALGDATGKEVVDSLLRVCRNRENITIRENCFAIDILVTEGRCAGVLIATGINTESTKKILYCRSIICASGGVGQVYRNTTNSEVVTGDGISMAYRSGAVLSDMEFVQFHPTAFYKPASEGSRFLISEAVRGEGGILLNINNERFMHKYHEMGEIAPRDIVSRAIFYEMKKTGSDHVYLDITHKDSDYLRKRFPTIYDSCLRAGVDITKDYIPVSPVQHYFMGGIRTDLMGRTNIEGLYACGEAANTGVHGANRLASNSLLEGLVFGRRSAGDINCNIHRFGFKEVHVLNTPKSSGKHLDEAEIRDEIKTQMDAYAGIERNGSGMEEALGRISSMVSSLEEADMKSVSAMETLNIAYIASLILKSAIARKKSCGSHYRTDSE